MSNFVYKTTNSNSNLVRIELDHTGDGTEQEVVVDAFIAICGVVTFSDTCTYVIEESVHGASTQWNELASGAGPGIEPLDFVRGCSVRVRVTAAVPCEVQGVLK